MTWDAARPPGPLKLQDLADAAPILYPNSARPNNADRILALFREHGVRPPAIHEVRELQTALGLVAAEAGICVVPASIERLRRDGVAYRPLDEERALIPVIMSYRRNDPSPETRLILQCVRDDCERKGLRLDV